MSAVNTPPPDADEVEYRGRLQRALGEDFELRELIGRGGFGSVYAAWDRKLERDVAVKALRHDLFPTRMVLERFEREAKAVAKLRHPNILPVYAVGQGDGVAYMIMPVIRGENLRQRMNRGLRVEDAVRIIADIGRALDAAHRLGIVHRDVKPENILLEGEEDHALLTDFGIAKSEGGDGALTGSGVIIGSVHYMSPEQASAERSLDGRSDIYSLGAVAYEALSGRKPYMATNMQQQLVLQFTTEPPPLSTIAASVPAATADVVMRALARDPAQRWPDAGDFAAALTATIAVTDTTRAEPASWFERRGLVVAVIYTVGIWTMLVSLPIDDLVNATGNRGMRSAIELVQEPLLVFVRIGILFLLTELVVTSVRARREGLTRLQVAKRLFGQPHWWQTWYPASLRDPSNIWAEIPLGMKLLKTILWLGLAAVLFTLPFGAIIQTLSSLTAGVNMALPLPVRLAFFFATAIHKPLMAAVAITVGGIIVLVWRRRVAFSSVARLLFTWRAEEWDTPDGRRLRGLG